MKKKKMILLAIIISGLIACAPLFSSPFQAFYSGQFASFLFHQLSGGGFITKAFAQNVSNTPKNKLYFLKQKDFDQTLNVLHQLTQRPEATPSPIIDPIEEEKPSPKDEAPILPADENTKPAHESSTLSHVLPRQNIDLNFASYADTRLFLTKLTERFGEFIKPCSLAFIHTYSLEGGFTLSVYMKNLNPYDISIGSSVEGANSLTLTLVDGALSEDCNIAALKPDELISSATLKTLIKNIIEDGTTLNEDTARKLFEPFGELTKLERGCFIRLEAIPKKDLNHLHLALTLKKPDCKITHGFTGLSVNYKPASLNNDATNTPDPMLIVKMFRVLEDIFKMKPIHNIGYLWKNDNLFGIIRTPTFILAPSTLKVPEQRDSISLEIGYWFGPDKVLIETLWNAGDQPYGGIANSEEFIP